MDNTLPLFAVTRNTPTPFPQAQDAAAPEPLPEPLSESIAQPVPEPVTFTAEVQVVQQDYSEYTVDNVTIASAPLDMGAIQAEHTLWLETLGKEGRRAHFRHDDLTGMNLSGYRFSGASMRGITLRDVNFSGADLSGCDLSESILDNVDLRGSILTGASLSHAQLFNVTFENAELTEANLQGVSAKDTSFVAAKLPKAVLRDANLQSADFTHALMNGMNARGAVFSGARFDHADVSDADCRDCRLDYANFAHAILHNTLFKDASLTAINLQDVDFTSAIEVSFDLQTQILLEEKKRLAQERAQLEDMGVRLSDAQKKFALREEAVSLQEKSFETATLYFTWVARAQKIVSALWLLLAGTLLFFTFTRLMQIGFDRVAGIVAGVGMVLILTFLSLYFTLKCRVILTGITRKIQKITKN